MVTAHTPRFWTSYKRGFVGLRALLGWVTPQLEYPFRNAFPMGGLSSETILAQVRPSRLLSAHYYVLVFLFLAGAVASLAGFLPASLVSSSFTVTLSAALATLAFFTFLFSELRRLSHKYTIYDHRVGVAEGILRKRVQYMPYSRVERIEINQSVIGRMFGIGNVLVDTGDDQVTLRAIRSPSKVEQLVSGCIRGGGFGSPRQSSAP